LRHAPAPGLRADGIVVLIVPQTGSEFQEMIPCDGFRDSGREAAFTIASAGP
jgi:hypothetical protein